MFLDLKVIASYKVPLSENVYEEIDLSKIYLNLNIDGKSGSLKEGANFFSVSDFILGVQKDILLLENEIKKLKEENKTLKEAIKHASK